MLFILTYLTLLPYLNYYYLLIKYVRVFTLFIFYLLFFIKIKNIFTLIPYWIDRLIEWCCIMIKEFGKCPLSANR